MLVTAIREKYFPVERVRGVLRRRRHKNVTRQLFTDDVVGKSSRISLHLPNVNPIIQFVAGTISCYFSTQSSVILRQMYIEETSKKIADQDYFCPELRQELVLVRELFANT